MLDGTWKDAMEGEPLFASNWKLLKLHGSSNWLVPYMGMHFQTLEYQSTVPNSDEVFLYWHSSLPYATHKNRWTGGYVPTTYCYYPPNIPGEYFKEAQLAPDPGHVFVRFTPKFLAAFEEGDSRGVPSSPVLITPVRQKKYDAYRSTVQSTWDQAVKALEEASRVVIAGYSFPPTDARPLDLIRSLLGARGRELTIEIVSPGATDIGKRIGDDYLGKSKELKLHDMKLEEYVDRLLGLAPSLMRQAVAEDDEVRQWLDRIYAAYKLQGGGNQVQ